MQEMLETPVQFLDLEDPLGGEMAAHSSILTWRIPWTEEPGRPTITGVARVRHHLAIKPSLPHSRGGTVER